MTSFFGRRAAALLLLASLAALPSCGDHEPTSPSRFNASFDAASWPDTIRVGEQRGLWARVIDATGRTVIAPPVTITTSTPDRIAVSSGARADSAYVEGLLPGLATVRAKLQTGVFNGAETQRSIPVVLTGVQLDDSAADTMLTEIGQTFKTAAAGLGVGAMAVPSSGLSWSRNGPGAVQIVALAGGDSVQVTAAAAGEDTITVTHAFCSGSCTASFAVRVKLAEAAALELATQPSEQARAGVVFVQQPVVQLVDEHGAPVLQSGITVTVSLATGAGALAGTIEVETNAAGVAVFSNLVIGGVIGTRTLRFDAEDLAYVISGDIDVAAGDAAVMTLHAGDDQTAERNSPVAIAPAVLIKDAYDNVVPGATVNYEVASGGGSVSNSAPSSDAFGVAVVGSWTLGSAVGSHTLQASASGLAGSPITFTATATATAAALEMQTQPSSSAAAGAAFAQQPAVRLVDSESNPVSQANVTVTAAIFSGGGTLLGTTQAETDADGLATFENLAIGGSTGSRTLRFTSGALTGVNSQSIELAAGQASKITVSGPSSVRVNTVSDAFTVTAQDAYDNAATVTAGTTLGLGSNTSGTATFYMPNGTTVITSVSIAAGTSSITFRYRDTAAGASRTVTVSRTGGDQVGSAQHTFAVDAGSARFVGGSSNTTNNANNTSSLVADRPSGLANGHVMIAMVTTGLTTGSNLPEINTPAGWTLLRSDSRTGIRQSVFYRVVSSIGTESSTYTFTISANARFSVAIAGYSGIKTSDPIAASGANTGTGSLNVAPSQSAPSGGGTVVSLFGLTTGHDIQVDVKSALRVTDSGNGGQRTSIAIGDDDITTTSTGTRSATSVDGTPSIGQIVVLRPN